MFDHICYGKQDDPRSCAVCERALPQFTMSTAQSPVMSLDAKSNYNMSFSNATGKTGELDFNGPEMKFTGDAEESAKVFFDFIAKAFSQRLAEERRRVSKCDCVARNVLHEKTCASLTMMTVIEAIVIGKWRLAQTPNGIWIGPVNDGEGGTFDETAVAKVIEEFYRENF